MNPGCLLKEQIDQLYAYREYVSPRKTYKYTE
jgi:hypothetical protein